MEHADHIDVKLPQRYVQECMLCTNKPDVKDKRKKAKTYRYQISNTVWNYIDCDIIQEIISHIFVLFYQEQSSYSPISSQFSRIFRILLVCNPSVELGEAKAEMEHERCD